MVDGISILFLVRCNIYVASLRFLRTRLSSERKHLSIHDLTSREGKNYSCVMVMKMSDSDNVLMAESSIRWVFLSNITNAFYDW